MRKRIPIFTFRFVGIAFFVVIIFNLMTQRLCLEASHKADFEAHHVRRVVDGDTIQIDSGAFVRYIGIDTPEVRVKKEDKWVYRPEPYAKKASRYNKKLLEKGIVYLKYDVVKHDKYNRLLAYVYTDDVFVNLEMLKSGYAKLLTIPPNVKYADEFREALKEARNKQRGIWRDQ